jgi:plasmid stabilization system protein ParE
MARVVWTDEARARLDEIVAYIATDSSKNALRVEKGIIQASRRMETLPYGGGIVEELRQYGVREIYYGVYRILYVIREETCYVVCVIHGSRDLMGNINPDDWIDLQ